jgi:hypothetical protein
MPAQEQAFHNDYVTTQSIKKEGFRCLEQRNNVTVTDYFYGIQDLRRGILHLRIQVLQICAAKIRQQQILQKRC